MTRREFEGRTAAEAAIKACDELGFTRADLRYEVVSETGEALERRVVIAVDYDEDAPPPRRDEVDSERSSFDSRPRGDGRGRDRDRGRGGRDRGRGGRDRGRGGRDRRGGGDRDRDRGRGGRGPRRNDEGDIDSLLHLDAMPTEPQAERPEVTGEPSARASAGREVLAELLRLSGFDLRPVLVQDGPEEIHFDLRGNDTARVIGNKGDALLALQFLINRMLARKLEGEEHLVLDAANYRNRRREALAQLARTLAQRAIDEKKVVRLSPMSAHDRRIFHITLQDHGGVSTRSEGEGLFRPLLIIPADSE